MGCVNRREPRSGQDLTGGLSVLWEPIVLNQSLLISLWVRVALPSFLEPGLWLIAAAPGTSLSGQPCTACLLQRPFFLPALSGAQRREGKSSVGSAACLRVL